MPCYYPVSAWQLDSGEVVFAERGRVKRPLQLPCGQCIGCRLERSRQWAVRCLHESQMHSRNSFVTLTYDDGHLQSPSLDYRDFQLFMKRLRDARAPDKVRFFMCGEYGEKSQRPHFHACLFGVSFDDMRPHSVNSRGDKLYQSAELESIWEKGYAPVGAVTFDSAAYVARYVTKKVTGPHAVDHYRVVDGETGEVWNRVPEFCHMSLKPGIGATWFDKYKSEVFPRDRVVVRGVECKPPRYYSKLAERDAAFDSDGVEFKRYKKAIPHRWDGTPERLAVREKVRKAQIGNLERSKQ